MQTILVFYQGQGQEGNTGFHRQIMNGGLQAKENDITRRDELTRQCSFPGQKPPSIRLDTKREIGIKREGRRTGGFDCMVR